MMKLCRYFFKMLSTVLLLHIYLFAQDETPSLKFTSLEELLNTPVSSAAKYLQHIHEVPASVSIITSEEIEQFGFQTLDEALMTITGFYTSNDRNYSYLGIRGFSRPTDYNNRILLLIDDHIANENVFNSALIGSELGLDMDMIDRIEIVRGPGSCLYGTNAMFAVINIVTKSSTIIDGTQFSGKMGSFGRKQAALLCGHQWNENINLALSAQVESVDGQDLYFKEYDDPAMNDGVAHDVDWDKNYGFYTQFGIRSLSLYALFTSREKAIPTGSWDTNFNDPRATTLDERQYVGLSYRRELSRHIQLSTKAFLDRYYFSAAYPYEDVAHDKVQGQWLGLEMNFIWDIYTNYRLEIGSEFYDHLKADYKYWDNETTYFEGSYPFKNISFYMLHHIQVSKNLFINAGLRSDHYTQTGNTLSPRGALIFNPIPSSTFKLVYGRAFRVPNLYENYYYEENYQKTNPDLVPEKIKTFEFVYDQKLTSNLLFKLSFYQNTMNGLIDLTVDPTDSLFFYQNINSVRAHGLEIEARAIFPLQFSGLLSYSIAKANDLADDSKLVNSPSHLFNVGVSRRFFRHITTSLFTHYESERITVYGSKTKAFFLTNANLTYASPAKPVSFSLSIKNLFNEDYALPGGYEHIQPAIPQNRRNYIFQLKYKFDF
jgi:outer membrane receptor for ferrienterochelin and colicins